MAFFRYDGHELAYTIHGKGPRTTILMPGLLLSQKMQTPLATDLAAHGNRVVTFDFLGHGASDRPQEMSRYSMPSSPARRWRCSTISSSTRRSWAEPRSERT